MASDHLTDTELARLALSDRRHPHVASCPACAAELGQLRGLVGRLRALPDPPERLLDAATEFYRRRRRLEALLERLTDDPAFRAKAKAKPEQVLREAGLDPAPELVEALRETERGSGDLARRIAAKHLWF
ncbi:MAG: hypothetical protein ACRDJ1_09020 [Actinomycetota bacterium]